MFAARIPNSAMPRRISIKRMRSERLTGPTRCDSICMRHSRAGNDDMDHPSGVNCQLIALGSAEVPLVNPIDSRHWLKDVLPDACRDFYINRGRLNVRTCGSNRPLIGRLLVEAAAPG